MHFIFLGMFKNVLEFLKDDMELFQILRFLIQRIHTNKYQCISNDSKSTYVESQRIFDRQKV